MTRTRSILVFGVVVVALIASAPAAPAQAKGQRGRMLELVNAVRERHHLPTLRLNVDLSHDAHHHSRRMAKRGTIFHTADLYSQVRRYGASSWGENVAKAGTLRRVKELWMASSPHRANMLNRSYRRAGVGVVRARGWVWVTVMFYG